VNAESVASAWDARAEFFAIILSQEARSVLPSSNRTVRTAHLYVQLETRFELLSNHSAID
jgi:hypothetical protein